jgi:hypothetical protein
MGAMTNKKRIVTLKESTISKPAGIIIIKIH